MSTLRKRTVDRCCTATISRIKTRLENNFINVAVDETTDVYGRYIANSLIGILSENSATKPALIAVRKLLVDSFKKKTL